MNNQRKIRLFLLSIIVLIVVLITWIKLISPTSTEAVWYNNSWYRRKPVTVSYTGSTLTNYHVLISLDTSSLISQSKLQSDCDDIRITDSDKTTLISYWIEGGCNTTTTQIWAQVPSILDGGKTIYVYYDNPSATNSEEAWSGTFTTLADATCPSNWTLSSDSGQDFYQKFPQGSASYGGVGGSDSHTHADLSGTLDGYTATSHTSGTYAASRFGHAHNYTQSFIATNVLPPYLDVLFCSNSKINFKPGLILLFDTTVPTDFSRFTDLDNKFPRGSNSYGTTGGYNSHVSSFNSSTSSSTSSTSTIAGFGAGFAMFQPASHSHGLPAGNTNPSDNMMPPYISIIYGKSSATTIPITSRPIVISTALPPLGWTEFSASYDNFLLGSSTYGTTGGSATHTHTIDRRESDQGPSSNFSNGSGGSTSSGARAGHRHTYTPTVDNQSNIPPYIDVLYIQRNAPITTASVGSEEDNNPTSPTHLLTEGEFNPIVVTDTTPEFSAICNNVDATYPLDKYRIQVDTNTFFSSPVWDSGSSGTAMTSCADATRSVDISFAGTPLSLNGSIYYWRIKFWNSQNREGPWSSENAFFKMDAPNDGRPSNCRVSETPNDVSLTLKWDDNSSTETQFRIEKNTNSGGYTFLYNSAADSTSYLDSSIASSNIYQYRIRAEGSSNSNWCETTPFSLQTGDFLLKGLDFKGLNLR